MSPIQQLFLGTGSAVATKTYVDDVFSTFLYEGTSSSHTINNGIDLSGEGGLTWFKNRSSTYSHSLIDTVRGKTKRLTSNDNVGEVTWTDTITSFNNNGFTLGTSDDVNDDDMDFSSWTFRKAPGFFTIKEFSGSNSAQTLSHDLGCVPGLILVKRTDSTGDWMVYHREGGATGYLKLNSTTSLATGSGIWNSTSPTSTTFSVEGNNTFVNQSGGTFIAYLFAGGESVQNEAVSVDFDAATESLYATSSDYAFGTGDFTIEAWIKPSNLSGVSYQNILDTRGSAGNSTTGFSFGVNSNGQLYVYTNGFDLASATNTIVDNQWYHIALVNNGGTIKAYVNGVEKGSFSNSKNFTNTTFRIAMTDSGDGAQNFVGSISNVRVVKGTAVYTSAFRPPTEPLTNITNTKLLCCNNSSTTGSTVASGTLTADGSPTASSDSPFDDPAGFVFGDAGDQNVIKCGSYTGNGSTDGPEINLGFEPQWVMVKDTSTGHWFMGNNMQGVVTGGNDPYVTANNNNAEYASYDWIEFTPTGFNLTNTSANINANGNTYIYMSIRRPDGYVGKPPELGTDVFTTIVANSGSDIPNFVSGFPVDFALTRRPDTSEDWYALSRLTGGRYGFTNTTAQFANPFSDFNFDSNTGWCDGSTFVSPYQSWMWKRHAGFDVVTYKGNGSGGRLINHSMNKAPEMLFIKNRTTAGYDWAVWHMGLNSGSSPEDYWIKLNGSTPEADDNSYWNDTAPTSTVFKIGTASAVNRLDDNFIAMLFASVEGISKFGYYTGTENTISVTTGFAPRFLFIRRVDDGGPPMIFDTIRGWGSGNDQRLRLHSTAAQQVRDIGAPTSTGFTLTGSGAGIDDWNSSGGRYIWYAHA